MESHEAEFAAAGGYGPAAEPPRQTAAVTFTVTAGEGTKVFTADSTTTGDAATTARKLVTAVEQDAVDWVFAQRPDPAADALPTPGALRRAAVRAVATVNGNRREVSSDSTTNGSVYGAAEQLVRAAGEELRDWAYDGAPA